MLVALLLRIRTRIRGKFKTIWGTATSGTPSFTRRLIRQGLNDSVGKFIPAREVKPMKKTPLGTWVFGSLLFLFFVGVFLFSPEKLPDYKQRMLAIACALLSGLLAFFLTGTIGLEIKWIKPRFGDIGVKATGGIAVFVLVLVWWMSPLAPVGVEEVKKQVEDIKGDTAQTLKIVQSLEEEFRKQLGTKDTQIVFLQGQLQQLQKVEEPSSKARQLAAQIPTDADPYALALKAIAENRFDDARKFLKEAQETKVIELSRIYEASGQTEAFAGHYADALDWYQKALALRPDDPALMNETAVAFFNAAKYAEAEPLCKRSLAIYEKALGPEHPMWLKASTTWRRSTPRRANTRRPSLSTSAPLRSMKRRSGRSTPMWLRASTTWRRSTAPRANTRRPSRSTSAPLQSVKRRSGRSTPMWLTSLNNLALLYYAQGKYAEAEPLYQRSLAIWEKALGPEHPDVATSLNNLAALYRAQGKYAEAEPLYQRALAIREKTLGPEHPDVATSLNNLAELYYTQGKYAEAEPLYQRSLAIWEKALGPEHPDVAHEPQQPGGALPRPGQIRGGRAALPAVPCDLGKGARAGAPRCGHEPQQPGGALLRPGQIRRGRAALPALPLRSGKRRSGRSTPMWPRASTTWRSSTTPRANTRKPSRSYKRSLAIREKALGPEHPDVAQSLNNLAELYRAQGKYAEAEPLYKRSLAIREKTLGPEHPDIAKSLSNLAALYYTQGKYAEGEPLLERSLGILEKALGPEHPNVAVVRENLIRCQTEKDGK